MRRFVTLTIAAVMMLALCLPAAPVSAHTANSRNQQSNRIISLQSSNFPDRYVTISTDGSGLQILPISDESGDDVKGQATFTLLPGLTDESMVSFQTNNGMFVVATADGVFPQSLDAIEDLSSATFNIVDGLVGDGVSFQSSTQSSYYLRHQGFVLKLHEDDGSPLFAEDASFIEVEPFDASNGFTGSLDGTHKDCAQTDFLAAVKAGESSGTITLDETCRYVLTSAGDNWNGGSGASLWNTTLIEGNGAIVERSTTAPSFRILALSGSNSVIIRNLTIRNGSVTGPGGGIWLNKDVTLEDVTFEKNSASKLGGAILAQKNLTLRNVVIKGSNANLGGAIAQLSGALTIDNSRLINNQATDNGGAIYKQAGAFALTNSVLAQNGAVSGNGAAIFAGGQVTPATITNSTITDNNENAGTAVTSWASLTLRNTIIANHTTALEIGGATSIGTEDYNLFVNNGRDTGTFNSATINSGGNSVQSPNARFVDASALDYTLKASSPAIDKGTDVVLGSAGSLATDAGGMARPYTGTGVDIGAYEYQGEGTASLSITKNGPLWLAPGAEADFSLLVANDGIKSGESLEVVDVLPEGAEYVADSATNGGTFANGSLTWQIGTLAPDEKVLLQYKVKASQTLVSQHYSVKSITEPEMIAQGQVITFPLNSNIVTSLNFWPRPDGFSFSNYSDSPPSDLTVEDMIYIFGRDVACKTTTEDSCVLTATMQGWRNTWLDFVKGGHCAGMAMGSLNLFANVTMADSALQSVPNSTLDLRQASAMQDGANITFDLAKENARKLVGLYAMTQVLPPKNSAALSEDGYARNPNQKLVPVGPTQQWRTDPRDVLDTLIANLSDPNATDRYRLSFNFLGGGGGHTVVPYAVEKLTGDDYLIHIYENNRPNQFGIGIKINKTTGVWSYKGRTNPSATQLQWNGNATSNNLSLTSWRYSATFPKECNTQCQNDSGVRGGVGAVEFQLDGEGYHLITRSDGKQAGFDLSTGEWSSDIEGAEAVYIATGLGLNTPPIIQMPHEEGMSYDVQIASRETAYGNTESSANVNIFGPNMVARLTDLVLNSPVPQAGEATESDPDLASLSIDPDDNRLTFEPGVDDAEAPTLSLAVSQADGADFSVDVKNVRVDKGHAVALGFNEETQSLTIEDNSGGETSYEVELNRINSDGTQDTFVSDGVSDNGQAGVTLAVGDEWDGEGEPDVQVEENRTLPAPAISAEISGNIALGKPVIESSIENAEYLGTFAVDGDSRTRWSSAYNEDYIQIDLGQRYDINRVVLNWDSAYAEEYTIVLSDSNDSSGPGTTLYSTTVGNGGIEDLTGLSGSGRYIRLWGLKRGTEWGFSLWEFEVYGTPTDDRAANLCDLDSMPDPTGDGVMVRFVNDTGEARYISMPGNELYTLSGDEYVSNLMIIRPGNPQDFETTQEEEWEIYYGERPWESDDPFTQISTFYKVRSEAKQCFIFSSGEDGDSGSFVVSTDEEQPADEEPVEEEPVEEEVTEEPGAEAAVQQEVTTCSTDDVPAPASPGTVMVRFVNDSAGTADLLWQDFDEELNLYHSIEAGGMVDQETFDTHNWVAQDEGGDVLLQYTATDAETQCVVIE